MVPMIREFQVTSELNPLLLVTDQHLNSEFGSSIREVNETFGVGLPIIPVRMQQNSDSPLDRVLALSQMNSELARALIQIEPDFVLLYGDRGESLFAACTCMHLRIPVIHLQGGDLSGSIDEWMRHAITKLSHIHYASTEESRSRIIQLGEEPWRVHNVGDSHLDSYVLGDYEDKLVLQSRYGIPVGQNIIVVLQHSETTDPDQSEIQMEATLEAVDSFVDFKKVIIYPSTDIGYRGILNAIRKYEGKPGFQVFQNLPSSTFRTLLKLASVIVGNSSCGLIEAPQVGTASVNIGRRQIRRPRGPSVIDCRHETQEIRDAIKRALSLKSQFSHESPYQLQDGLIVGKRISLSLQLLIKKDREEIWKKDFFDQRVTIKL